MQSIHFAPPDPLTAHRTSAFALIRCPPECELSDWGLPRSRWVAVTRRGGLELNPPGGKLEPGETALACAVRETREETGLVLDPTRGVWICTIGYASFYLWDWPVDPVLVQVDPEIGVGIVTVEHLRGSQYWALFNGPAIAHCDLYPRGR